jgi:hypothetical protein
VVVPPEATVAALKEEIHRLRPELPSVKLFSVQLGENALKDSDDVGSLGLASGAGLFAMEEARPYAAIVAKMRLWRSAFDDGESEWPHVVFTLPEFICGRCVVFPAAVFAARGPRLPLTPRTPTKPHTTCSRSSAFSSVGG